MSIRAQRFLGCVLIVAGLAYATLSFYGEFHAGTIGIISQDANGTITQLDPAGAAARAGIRKGDRIDILRADPATRYYETVAQLPPLGTVLSLPVVRDGRSRTYAVAPEPRYNDPISPWKRPISALLVLTAGLLVLLRPQRATWAFLAYALVTMISLDNQYLSYPWQIAPSAVEPFARLMPPVALVLFAVWFLRVQSKRWHVPLTVVVIAGATLGGIVLVYDKFAPYFGVLPVATTFGATPAAWEFALSGVTLAVLIETFASGRRENRQRIAWVIAAFGFAIVFQSIVPIFVDISSSATFVGVNWFAYAAWSISPLVVAAAVLYSMTRYRVIDLRIAVSRALVYSITTFVIILAFTLIEWAAAKLFEGSNVATYAAVVAVLLIGFASNSVHRHVDAFIDVVFFSRQKAAERRLRHLATALLYTASEETIVKFIVTEPARALDLVSAALFIESAQGEALLRVASVGWKPDATTRIERTDEIVPQMRAADSAVHARTLTWTDERLPQGLDAPLLAIPLKAHGDLFGIALYGGHTDGGLLTDDECALLNLLAQNAAAAYDHIDASRARVEIERLRADFARLQARLQLD